MNSKTVLTRAGPSQEPAHRQLLDKYTDADMHNLLAYLVTLK